MSLNRALLIGRLGRDPEMKTFDSGRALTTFTMATDERWKDKQSGEKQEKTEWHRIVAWGKTAELANRCLSKGRQVCVEGKIQTRKWKTKEGEDRTTTEVVAQNITFLDSPHKEGHGPATAVHEDSVPF